MSVPQRHFTAPSGAETASDFSAYSFYTRDAIYGSGGTEAMFFSLFDTRGRDDSIL